MVYGLRVRVHTSAECFPAVSVAESHVLPYTHYVRGCGAQCVPWLAEQFIRKEEEKKKEKKRKRK